MVPKIGFGGNPPRIEFALFKQDTGVNLVDIASQKVHSLGEEGQLAGVLSDVGNSLRRTLDATLATMKPGQSLRVQVFVHGTAGFDFAGHPFGYNPSITDQMAFVFGMNDEAKATVTPVKTKLPQNQLDKEKQVVILGLNDQNFDGVRHPYTGNEDSGSDIIDLK